MARKIYAFDVDETLEVSNGPIKIEELAKLYLAGHIVGLCGNWARFVQSVGDWSTCINFLGPMEMTKEAFLTQLKDYIPAEEVVMVGNIKGISGHSDDQGAAHRAGVRFISEWDFANGSR